MPLANCDSLEYEILIDAVNNIKDVSGFTCEIGVREGGSTKIIIDTLKATNQNKIHIAIDPYGDIPYWTTQTCQATCGYHNSMKRTMLAELYAYCLNIDQEVLYFPLESYEFCKRFSDGVPVYNNGKHLINQYALAFIDGSHKLEDVLAEFSWFEQRIAKGGYIVFDDIHIYPHIERLDNIIMSSGYVKMKQGNNKISYKRM